VIVLLIPPAGSFLSAAVERSRGSCNRSDLVSKVNVYRESSNHSIMKTTLPNDTLDHAHRLYAPSFGLIFVFIANFSSCKQIEI
jgi:hypothetical protein